MTRFRFTAAIHSLKTWQLKSRSCRHKWSGKTWPPWISLTCRKTRCPSSKPRFSRALRVRRLRRPGGRPGPGPRQGELALPLPGNCRYRRNKKKKCRTNGGAECFADRRPLKDQLEMFGLYLKNILTSEVEQTTWIKIWSRFYLDGEIKGRGKHLDQQWD